MYIQYIYIYQSYISQSILGHLNQPAAPGPERGGLLLSGDCLNATHAMGGAHHRPAPWTNLEDLDWFCWESLQKIMIFTYLHQELQGLKWLKHVKTQKNPSSNEPIGRLMDVPEKVTTKRMSEGFPERGCQTSRKQLMW
jgi:hypothetical protein